MWLNLEYLYEKIYQIFVGPHSGLGFLKILAVIIWIGLILAMPLLLWLIIYLIRRLNALSKAEADKFGSVGPLSGGDKVIENKRWEEVFSRLNSTSESDWKLAIIEADVMLDQLIADVYPHRGDTLGERLKNVEPSDFTTLQNAWEAHKIRNQIAHDHSYVLTAREARTALEHYKKVFEEFHYI